MFFKFRKKVINISINSKFQLNDFVDFWHRDDIYFGVISDIKIDKENIVLYDIDIAGQCPTTFKNIPESKVIRIHKD